MPITKFEKKNYNTNRLTKSYVCTGLFKSKGSKSTNWVKWSVVFPAK